eukprot:gene6661-8997_t
MILLLLLTILFLTRSQLLTKNSVIGYCSDNSCNFDELNSFKNSVNSFSVTTYHLNASGLVSLCSNDYSACSWDGDVERFNLDAEIVSGMKSSPLLFNNEGSMLSYFRAMVSDPDKRSATISSLIDSSE